MWLDFRRAAVEGERLGLRSVTLPSGVNLAFWMREAYERLGMWRPDLHTLEYGDRPVSIGGCRHDGRR